MSVFLDRRQRAGPYLEWKVRVFILAAVLGLSGIYFDERWLTGAAIVLLLSGLALRWLPANPTDSEGEDEPGAEVP